MNNESNFVDIRAQLADDAGGWPYELLERIEMPVTKEKLNTLLFQTKFAKSRKLDALLGAWDITLDESMYEVHVTDAESSLDSKDRKGTIHENQPLLHYNMMFRSVSEGNRPLAYLSARQEDRTTLRTHSAYVRFEKTNVISESSIQSLQNSKSSRTPDMAEIFQVSDYAHKLNPSIVDKGGVFISLNQSQATRIHLELIGLRSALAVRVLMVGLDTNRGGRADCQTTDGVQDYTALNCDNKKVSMDWFLNSKKEASQLTAAPQGSRRLNEEYYSFEIDFHEMLRNGLSFLLPSQGEMKPLNSVMTPKELGLRTGSSLLVNNCLWKIPSSGDDGANAAPPFAQVDSSTPRKDGMVHVIGRYKTKPRNVVNASTSKDEDESEDEDESDDEDESTSESSEDEEEGPRPPNPPAPRYRLRGLDPRMATKSMINRVEEFRKSSVAGDAEGSTNTRDDRLHPRVYDTRPTHKIHVHVLSERYFQAVTGRNRPGAFQR